MISNSIFTLHFVLQNSYSLVSKPKRIRSINGFEFSTLSKVFNWPMAIEGNTSNGSHSIAFERKGGGLIKSDEGFLKLNLCDLEEEEEEEEERLVGLTNTK